ncbi:MAG: DegV family protein [Gammaproteobacteria bacterium]|jgi:DegV family protein with EDD domain|nr:DegV family protein [Gammaproteobacteria bacterium]
MADGISYIDGPRLQRCFAAGLERLIGEREFLNKINVFPVADGDTGNNMYRTALAARIAIADGDAPAGELLVRLADGALDGAQGNSGAILAQFFQGLATPLASHDRIDAPSLAAALEEAAVATRSALTTPREGTIISVIDAVARAAAKHRKSGDFARLLPAMLAAGEQALAATTGQLEELSKAGVVDAGARGFVSILEGCVEFLTNGSLRDLQPFSNDSVADFTEHAHHEHDVDLEFRYCTECMLEGADLDPARLRQELAALGNSMVIAGSKTRLRIHIHTNEPETIFDLAAAFGTVSRTKADDMLGQARTLSRVNRDVAIVTDSGADIPEAIMADFDIQMVPLRVQFGEDSHLDKLGMSPAEFRTELLRNPARPGTSQPTPGDLRRMYEFLGTHFKAVISVNLSAALSGTWQSARAAAERTSASERIRVIDSKHVSVGQGLAVVRAAELAAQGLRGAELEAAIELEMGRIKNYALVADLTNAVRSGRVKPLVKHIADWLRLTPVLTSTPAGKVGISGFILGRRNLTTRFARHVARRQQRGRRWRFAIAHGYHEEADAALLGARLQQLLPESECAWQTEIGAALGVHAGMAALVVALCECAPDATASQTPPAG